MKITAITGTSYWRLTNRKGKTIATGSLFEMCHRRVTINCNWWSA